MLGLKRGFVNYLTLFGSAGTLICCALPSLLVSLGMGAVLAGLASNVPGLVWVSENKNLVFAFAGMMLLLNGFLIWSNRSAPCPLDPKLRDACISGRRTSKHIFITSLIVYALGFFFAYIATLF